MTNQELYEQDLKIIPKGGSKSYVIDGFNACIRRHGQFGHLCGYVEVPDGLSVDIDEIDCHGASHLTTIGASSRLTVTISVSIAYTTETGTHSVLGLRCQQATTLTKTVSLS